MKIKVFWHVWLHHNWRPIIAEQILLMVSSGLYEAAFSISVSVIGNAQDMVKLDAMLRVFSKFNVEYRGVDPKVYEFPTLTRLYDDAWMTSQVAKGEAFIAFYFHSKGVSYPNDEAKLWRDLLNEGVINQWRKHYLAIKRDGLQVGGQNFLPGIMNSYQDHFSGNFWAANSSYVATLKNPRQLNHANRYEAEWWICSGKPEIFAMPFHEVNFPPKV